MPSHPTDFYLEGRYGPGNLGDDVLMLVTANLLKAAFPGVSLSVRVSLPALAEPWLPGVTMLSDDNSSPIDATALVYGGGGQFFAFAPGEGRLIRLANRVLTGLRARKFSVRRGITAVSRMLAQAPETASGVTARHRAAFAVGVGPFAEGSPVIDQARRELGACGSLSVRDPESLQLCRQWGLPAQLRADPTFLTPFWQSETPAPRSTAGTPRVGMVIRHWPHTRQGRGHVAGMVDATQRLRAEGLEVDFIALSWRYDQPAVKATGEKDVRHWEPAGDTPSRFIARLAADYQTIVSARAHGVMLLGQCGVPGIAVAIERKLEQVHGTMPNGTLLWGAPYDGLALAELVKTMLQRRTEYVSALAADVAAQETLAWQGARELVDWLGSVCGLTVSAGWKPAASVARSPEPA